MEGYDHTVRKLTQRSPRSAIAVPVFALFAVLAVCAIAFGTFTSDRAIVDVTDSLVDRIMGAVAQHVAVHTSSVELHGVAAMHAFRRLGVDNFSLDGLVLRTTYRNHTLVDFQNASRVDRGQWMRDLLVNAVSPPALVIDLGSGVGEFAMFAASEGFRVRAIERRSDVCTMLELSKRINGFNRMAVLQSDNSTRIDEVADGASFLRVNSNGSEIAALESAGILISQAMIPHVAIESDTVTSEKILRFMEAAGYGCVTKRGKDDRNIEYCVSSSVSELM